MLINNEAASPGFKKDTARANVPDGRPPEHVGSAIEPNYGFAADAALEAASAAALAAAAASLAAEAAASGAGAAAGGGVVSAAGAGASVLLPQAPSTNAATKALRASLVFIYRYPRNIENKILRPSVLLGLHPNLRCDFRVFCLNFISLSRPLPRL
jgi:hypothetical protein